ncbi:MotA/TolQ/ExbB proton channel family protein [Phaeovibrio sulfidiphilus]|uniref:MotA/TolQ/ExbB proton channel family protein n=1 Tax=Phaeovibrio sulfidiphilus TaxID=1220600 RepID=A0A8J6YPX0_9PROT|nr:MotA/TolQ/ExbB proton channel family protein [Phaeovibrio sulfidiphilus]MBE1237764.1 MotA/TolQ/ExbB proton channel family protein [Phaeovibrio sulfidiphilus]
MADNRSLRSADSASSRPDLATVVGIGGALVLIALALVLGGDPGAFLNGEAFLIVICGTLAVTLASFTFRDVFVSLGLLRQSLFQGSSPVRTEALKVLSLAEFARKFGVLRLQGKVMTELRSEPLLYKGLSLVVDGMAETEIEAILLQDIHSNAVRYDRAVAVLRRGAEVAPAMGLIGTMIGLVQMLGRLSDPASIGPGMAVALLTTFYGAILGNVVLLPLASKLERRAGEEALAARITVAGILSISRKENPRRLELLLNALLPPAQRVHVYE